MAPNAKLGINSDWVERDAELQVNGDYAMDFGSRISADEAKLPCAR